MIDIHNRNELTFLLENNSVGCELGVFEGDFSEILINSNKFVKLFLVDTFDGEASNFGKIYKDSSILEKSITSRFNNTNIVDVVKSDSVSFLQSLSDNFLDFVYIDTVHDYKHTMKELNEAYRVVKKNGLICGHDYTEKYFPGVVKSVKEFCDLYSLCAHVTTDTEDYPSFYIINS